MNDIPTPPALPIHIESLQQSFGPEADPAFRSDAARTDVMQRDCGNGLIRTDYTSAT